MRKIPAPKFPGIYGIRNLKTSAIYVGSSVNIADRWKAHRWGLRNNRHSNSRLQRAWNKYGEASFDFVLIKGPLMVEELLEAESAAMSEHRQRNELYNLTAAGPTKFGTPHAEETKLKIGSANRGRPRSQESRQLMVEAQRLIREREKAEGIRRECALETRAKIGAANRGRLHSDQSKQKMIASKEGKPLSERQIAANTSRRGRKALDETRGKQSAALKRRPWSPARRAAQEARQMLRPGG